ncbi:MAG: MBL fold metallo-hydrolase [Halobacteria archaeon]|nr:MBL fold metallo-hydrolase [Halobacteria archaeon]
MNDIVQDRLCVLNVGEIDHAVEKMFSLIIVVTVSRVAQKQYRTDTIKSLVSVSLYMFERAEGYDDLYIVDTRLSGHERHCASFILDAEKTAIIDTGASPGVNHIFDALEEVGIERDEVDYIAPTHVHMDHAGGAGYLADECENATIICHEIGVDYLSDPEKIEKLVKSVHRAVGEMAEGYGDLKPIPRERFEPVTGGEKIDLGDRHLEVIYAPGHAPHQVCFYESKNDAIFTADEAGMWLYGEVKPTTPPPNFNYDRCLKSLEEFKEYGPEKIVYTHFGVRDDPLKALDEYADVLTNWVNEIKEAKEKYGDEQRIIEEIAERESLYYDIWNETSAKETIRMDVQGVLKYLEDKEE